MNKSSEPVTFSLVLATLGRVAEVDAFLESLQSQAYPLEDIEVIVVDQNAPGYLDSVIEKYSRFMKLVHCRSEVKGLSANRNLGLTVSSGKWVGFPDDDCKYYVDTLYEIKSKIINNGERGILMGCIYDREKNVNIIRSWPKEVIDVDILNFFRLTSSIAMFGPKCFFSFDEKFGVGAKYGSNEDADVLLGLLERGVCVRYYPEIQVWHPEQNTSELPAEKVYSYGLGFGALARKHLSPSMVVLLILSCGYHLAHMIIAFFKADFVASSRRWVAFKSRLAGFVAHK